jgi:hypothetical protein
MLHSNGFGVMLCTSAGLRTCQVGREAQTHRKHSQSYPSPSTDCRSPTVKKVSKLASKSREEKACLTQQTAGGRQRT